MTYIKNFKGQTENDCYDDENRAYDDYKYYVYLYGTNSIFYFFNAAPK